MNSLDSISTAQQRARAPGPDSQSELDLSDYERGLQLRLFSAVLLIPKRFTDWMQSLSDDVYVRSDDVRKMQRSVIPTGIRVAYSATEIPSGWLRCNFAAVSRSDYAPLFARIGTTFGAGDGSTTFNVPNEPNNIIAI